MRVGDDGDWRRTRLFDDVHRVGAGVVERSGGHPQPPVRVERHRRGVRQSLRVDRGLQPVGALEIRTDVDDLGGVAATSGGEEGDRDRGRADPPSSFA